MSGFLLRLAGPLQSWGEHSAYGVRDTLAFPTRSGLIGMFAAARGLPRGADLSGYGELEFTVRIDRPGVRMVDFHTIGGGLPASRTVPTAEGKRRGADMGTIVTERAYLAGAVFTVAVAASAETSERITGELLAPHWQPYLGRRNCVPEQPLVLRRKADDPVDELLTRVPLPVPAERWQDRAADHITVDVVYEGEPSTSHKRQERTILSDAPRSFSSAHREYATRSVTVLPEELPRRLSQWGDLRRYRAALHTYAREGR